MDMPDLPKPLQPHPDQDPLELDDQLIAEINSVEPDYPVPDRVGKIIAEALTWVCTTLDLHEIHELLWNGYKDKAFSDEDAARWSERSAVVLTDWLRDHGIPRVTLWYPSQLTGEFVLFTIKAAPKPSR